MPNPRHLNLTIVKFLSCIFILLAFTAGHAAKALAQSDAAASAAPANLAGITSEEIVNKLVQANARRAHDLRGFTGKRVYNLDYQGFPGHREASMAVTARYSAPATKSFDMISESGSKWIVNHVLKRLLGGEKDSASPGNQRRTALTTDNYKFLLLGTRPSRYGGCYLLRVEPVLDNKYLFRGEICVNGKDFAVETIDAAPAKNPSFWIKNTHIEHQYMKIGAFWLPASNKSVTKVLLGGTATLTITYTDYHLNPKQLASEARN